MENHTEHEMAQRAHVDCMGAPSHEEDKTAPCVGLQAGLEPRHVEVAKAPPYSQDVPPPILFAYICGECSTYQQRTLKSEASVDTFGSDRADLSSRSKSSQTIGLVPGDSQSNVSTQSFQCWNRNSTCGSAGASLPTKHIVCFAECDHNPQDYRSAHLSITDTEGSCYAGQHPHTCLECLSHASIARQTGSNRQRPLHSHDIDGAEGSTDAEARPSVRTEVDLIDLENKKRLQDEASMSKLRKAVKWVAVLVALAATIAMMVLLRYSEDKTMTRAAFMGCVLIVDAAGVAWLIAYCATRVEILIAATLVFVAGIFLIPNIDTFFGYK